MTRVRTFQIVAPVVIALGASFLVASGSEGAFPVGGANGVVSSLSPSAESDPGVQAGVVKAAIHKRAAAKRKRATVKIKVKRTSSSRVQVQVKTNAKRSVVRAYRSNGKRLVSKTLRHKSSKKWVKVTLSKSANPARRVTATTKKVKVNKKLVLLAKKKTVTIAAATKPPANTTTAAPSAQATEILALVNSARSVPRKCGGKSFPAVKKLSLDSKLSLASQRHSNDMAAKNYFDHVSLSGSQPWDRATAAGYKWSRIGENIAAGQQTASAAMKGWLDSPGHCENIMGNSWTHLGVGVATNSKSKYGIYWTQLFGTPR